MKNYLLSASEKYNLETQHRTARDSRESDRIKAVLLDSENWSIEAIAQVLRKSEMTVRRHICEYHDVKKLHCENGGSKSSLNDKQKIKLIEDIRNNDYTKISEIVANVKKKWGITYSVGGMAKWLHRNGFSYKKPKGKPYKADEEAQVEFIQAYEKLKVSAGEKDQPILFMDAVHPTQTTKLANGWMITGIDKAINTTGRRTRINLVGCIQLGHLSDTLTAQYDTVNAESIIDFLQRIHDKYKDKKLIHLILDCAGYNKTDDVIKKAKDLNIELRFLPPYSPNLNPIERLWKVMNEKARNNVFFSNAKEFRENITNFFDKTLPKIGSTLDSRINDNFQLLGFAF